MVSIKSFEVWLKSLKSYKLNNGHIAYIINNGGVPDTRLSLLKTIFNAGWTSMNIEESAIDAAEKWHSTIPISNPYKKEFPLRYGLIEGTSWSEMVFEPIYKTVFIAGWESAKAT